MESEKFIIQGGKALSGTIKVNGAKNAALKVLAAALLSREQWTIEHIPLVEDVLRILELLRTLGVTVDGPQDRCVKIRAASISSLVIDVEIAKRIRASMVLTGPLLARCGEVAFPHPGGCVIGERPIDFFLKGFEKFGAQVDVSDNYYRVRAPKNGLGGADIFFPQVSVTGTETLMMTAVLAKGKTVLRNAAMEPEVVSLADFLNTCGACITGQGTPFITIAGVADLGSGTYKNIPDRIEAGSLALAAAITHSRLTIADCNPLHLDSLWSLLQDAGVRIECKESSVDVDASGMSPFQARHIKTHAYPGFPTDLQAPAVVFLTQAKGDSHVHETIFEGRLAWTQDLVRMGAHIDMADPHRIFVHGPTPLKGKSIESPDIRAGMAFILAGLCAEGETEIHNIYQIDRGYEKIEERLRGVGADIRRVPIKD